MRYKTISTMEPRKALGRGLAALLPDLPTSPHSDAESGEVFSKSLQLTSNHPPSFELTSVSPEFFYCALEEIAPSSDNPRQYYDERRMIELSDSISAQGLIQPLVVRKRSVKEQLAAQVKFVLIAGERRWRAAQRAGLKKVPIVIKEATLDRAFELALVENLQREDLNPIEEAEAYRRLSEEFGYTQEQLAERVGRARETVTNSLRLLKLPPSVQQMVIQSELSMGHARALLSLEDKTLMEQTARHIAMKQLSVRQTEELLRRARQKAIAAVSPISKTKSPIFFHFEEQLQKSLGTSVRLVSKNSNSGRIEIEYHSLDQFDELFSRLTKEK